jgi:membrane protein YqaA with SNARE-associated domain
MDLLTNPLVWILVLVLAGIGLAGSLPTYYLGRQGMPYIRERFPKIKEERWEQIGAWFQRWGTPIVLLTVLPGFGTVIPPAAGAHGIRLGFFILLVAIAKIVRFWFIILFFFGSTRALRNFLES